MGELYLSDREKEALRRVDIREVERLVEEARTFERASGLYPLHLAACGPYVAQQLRKFERDLTELAKAKAAKKREDLRGRVWSSGWDLTHAISATIDRMVAEEKELQLFRVSEYVIPPHRLHDRIDFRVDYQWRKAIEDSWTFSSITFVHDVDTSPDYTLPQPRRKPSAAKLERERQDLLFRHWEQLRQQALYSVREFLKSGGDASTIPKTFQAKPDRHSRWLNNFSCNFWRSLAPEGQPKPSGATD